MRHLCGFSSSITGAIGQERKENAQQSIRHLAEFARIASFFWILRRESHILLATSLVIYNEFN